MERHAKANQRQRVLERLRSGGGLTVREAVIDMGINSLPKRIEELRKQGFDIEMTWIIPLNGARYGIYTLNEEA